MLAVIDIADNSRVTHMPAPKSFGTATFILAADRNNPTFIEFRVPSLQLALVDRNQHISAEDWACVGFYFLIGCGSEPGRTRVYVGQSGNLNKRIAEHVKAKDWWDRALLVASNRRDGFSTAEAEWFEGYFINLLRQAAGNHMDNRATSSNESLPAHHLDELRIQTAPIEAILRVLNINTDAMEPELVSEPAHTAAMGSPQGIESLTWVEASLRVMPADGSPMHANDIVEAIRQAGLRDLSNALTPGNTLRRDLRQEAGKPEPRVQQVGPSMFVRA